MLRIGKCKRAEKIRQTFFHYYYSELPDSFLIKNDNILKLQNLLNIL